MNGDYRVEVLVQSMGQDAEEVLDPGPVISEQGLFLGGAHLFLTVRPFGVQPVLDLNRTDRDKENWRFRHNFSHVERFTLNMCVGWGL